MASNVFSALADTMANIVKDTVKIRSLNKKDLQDLIQENIKTHNEIARILSYNEDRTLNDWVRKEVNPNLKAIKDPYGKDIYVDFVKMLKGKAASTESKRALGALRDANEKFSGILGEIGADLDKLLEEESVDIYHVRVSHLAALGIIRQSDKVCNFSIYLYALMVRAASKDAISIPRYRQNYLRNNVGDVAKIVSDILDKKGAFMFLQEVKSLRGRAADVVLGANGSFDTPPMISGFYMPNFIDTLVSALSALNIFRIAIDLWDDYQMAKYRRNKEMRDWMEQHVTLLKMDLEGMDKTSPEYIQLTKAIAAYDDKIASYDKDILAFEQAEE